MNFLKQSLVVGAILLPGMYVGVSAENWMTKLPDEVEVRKLSIPGAHDAATGNDFTSGSVFGSLFSGVTQSLDLSDQWDAGIRVFDLRPAFKENVDGRLQIYHGILETKISMKSALQTFVDKLEENPGEMAVVLMRHESDSDNNTSSWSSAVSELLIKFDEHIVKFSPGLTLGDARGKILVLSRDSFTSDKAAMISGWSHSENFNDQKRAILSLARNKAVLYAQDFYDCQTVERKYNAITAMLDYSTTNISNDVWVINHVSGYVGSTGTNSNVLKLAKELNRQIADYLDESEGRTGIVMIDFAGAELYSGTEVSGKLLVEKIISQNDKYIHSDNSSVAPPVINRTSADSDSVYDMQGRYIGKGIEILANMPKGVYIYNRRKILIK